MAEQIGDVSEDGFWVLTAEGWKPSEKQNQALEAGAIPYSGNEKLPTEYSVEPQLVNIYSENVNYQSSNSVIIWRIAAGAIVVVGIVVIAILMLSQSAEEKALIGKWENEVDSLNFKEGGELSHQGGLYDGWSVDGNTIIFTDSSDSLYEWHYKYQIDQNILFSVGLDESGEPIDGECVVMVKKGFDIYEEYDKVTDPYWCTSEVNEVSSYD